MERGRKEGQPKAVQTLWETPKRAEEVDGQGMGRMSWQGGRYN